ncbi:MAG: glutathione S-transferase family protein [Sandaracinaceae bacterium]|nr:glutathione S-transferase family protein [Sandaracinaceae bacterium]MBP7683119.1 glutathione S-transferase family protein [Deltaproteobacteria bacterium]
MTHYKLTYFDMDGGRAESIRLAFHIGDIPFEDERWAFPEFGQKRSTLRFNALPVMTIDGAQVTQSNALNRYVGRLAGLYPQDALQALYCDEALDAVEDIGHQLGRTFGLKGDAMRDAREALVKGPLTCLLKGLDQLLTRGGGQYFADERLTVADLKVFVQVRALTAGYLDHIPTTFVQELTPALAAHCARIGEHPRIAAYYASRKR